MNIPRSEMIDVLKSIIPNFDAVFSLAWNNNIVTAIREAAYHCFMDPNRYDSNGFQRGSANLVREACRELQDVGTLTFVNPGTTPSNDRQILSRGTRIKWADMTATVIEDDGSGELFVHSDESDEDVFWAWEVDEECCEVIS